MSLSFMVVAGPRSATSWISTLLTTDSTLCIHDPRFEYTLDQITRIAIPDKKVGISCTAAMYHPDWVNSQRCPKVVLYRNPSEINAALGQLGLERISVTGYHALLDAIKAPMYFWSEVFKTHVAESICNHLKVPFDVYRFRELVKMNIQPQWNRLPVAREALLELSAAIARAGEEGR